MAGADDNHAEGTHNDEEGWTTVSAAYQQPPDDKTAATTPTGPAAAADSSQSSNDADVPNLTSENQGVVKEEIAPETTNANEGTETNTAKNDTTSEEVQPLNVNDDVLLSFGDTDGGDAEVENPGEKNEVPAPSDNINQETTSSNDFDLIGSPQAEVTNPSPDVNVVSGAAPSSDNQSTETALGPHDLLGTSHGENASINDVQQQSSELADPMGFEQLHSPTEKKEGEGECIATDSHKEIIPVMDTASLEKQESISEGSGNEEGVNQSENEDAVTTNEGNSVVEEEASPPVEEEGGVTTVDSQKEDAPAIDVASPENKESTNKSNDIVEGANQSESVGVATTNERDSMVEEQADEANSSTDQGGVSELDNVEATPEEQEIDQVESEISPTSPPPPMDTAPLENGEKINNEADDNASAGHMNGVAEERTEEEEEWLSMGLGLGDALRQIVVLTEERDSTHGICQEKDDGRVQAEALLVEVQSRLETEMNRRAEFESEVQRVRKTSKSYDERLAAYETMEDDLEKAQANLVTMVSEKSRIEVEVQKLREMRDESQHKEVVLSNRLNDAKKKEANKSTAAGRLEADNENLMEDLQRTKDELENTSKAKAKLESNMEKLKAKAVGRVKQAESALSEERELNEERKKKMKVFVETKAEELREAKDSANDMQKELEETRASLRSSRDREEVIQKELEAARLKYRELQRDTERMKRNSEQLHRAGNNLEQELEKSASETEEHKKKRMSAKHEIMQMVRTLEVERAVSAKLRESVKFTFTPKALSQQELLTECLRDFQVELERLAAKTGKTLLPSSESNEQVRDVLDRADSSGSNGASRKSRKTRASKADMDAERLVSNLEQETQHVSKGIMALAGSIEKMRSLLSDDFGCMTYFSNILAGTGEAQHQRLGDSDVNEENNSDQFV